MPGAERTLVVIPTYDERGTIAELVQAVRGLREAPDVLVVDDASPDGTGELVDELAARDGGVAVLHRTAKEGLGPAYRAGLGWGLERDYDVLVEMDADLSHDPSELPRLLARVRSADLVIGSRYVPGGSIERWPRRRLALSTAGNLYVRALTGLPVRDATSGFRAFRHDVLRTIEIASLRSDGYAFQVETALRAWRAGFAVAEVPIRFVERREGASKLSRRVVLEAMWRVPRWGLAARRPGAVHPASVRAGPRGAASQPPAIEGRPPGAEGRPPGTEGPPRTG
jgi:glycosyltransferase involved in cell wall biosynthesis